MTRRALASLVIVGLVAALVVLVQRVRLEARYRAVEIVLDGDDWLMLITREGRDRTEVLASLRERGATSMALSDPTLKRLADDGAISYASGASLASMGRLAPLAPPIGRLQSSGGLRSDSVYITGTSDTLEYVAGRLQALLGAGRVRRRDGLVEARGTQTDLEEAGLGFRPADAEAARAAGLDVVLRPRNYRGLSPESLRVLADGYAMTAPEPTLIFALTEVQGYEGLVDEAAAEYRRIGARFGRIEVFTARRKQRGEDRLTALVRPAVIRVFSITPEELQVIRPGDAADRFVRAAQERNIRLLYVRPLLATGAGVNAIDVNLAMVERINTELRAFGFNTARGRPMAPLEVPKPVIWVVAVGALALGLIVLDGLAAALGQPLAAPVIWGLLVAGTAASVLVSLSGLEILWRQVLALGVAIAGATGAVVWALPGPRPRASVVIGWLTLLRALVLAVGAGLLVAALLSQWPFMMAFSTFLGVKLAHVVPVVLVGLWMAFRGRSGGWRDTARDLKRWVNEPLRIGAALSVVVVGLAGVMLLARTGNISLPLSGLEQQLRAALEEALVARPRTKEFLLGYPALVLAGIAAARGWRQGTLVFALAGAIGTAGAINSFSHLHTPLFYTMWRTGNALMVGAVLAIPAAVVLLWITRRISRS